MDHHLRKVTHGVYSARWMAAPHKTPILRSSQHEVSASMEVIKLIDAFRRIPNSLARHAGVDVQKCSLYDMMTHRNVITSGNRLIFIIKGHISDRNNFIVGHSVSFINI